MDGRNTGVLWPTGWEGIIKFRFKRNGSIRRNTRLINPLPAGTGFTTVNRTRIYVRADGCVLFLPRPITVVVGGPFRIRSVRIEMSRYRYDWPWH